MNSHAWIPMSEVPDIVRLHTILPTLLVVLWSSQVRNKCSSPPSLGVSDSEKTQMLLLLTKILYNPLSTVAQESALWEPGIQIYSNIWINYRTRPFTIAFLHFQVHRWNLLAWPSLTWKNNARKNKYILVLIFLWKSLVMTLSLFVPGNFK